jgi:alcohol dehydrogenase, propanol-preferring
MTTEQLPATMRAWVVTGRAGGPGRLALTERPVPEPADDEVLVKVRVCGICRTDLHLADHDLAPRAAQRVPGHEIVGEVTALGRRADRFVSGDRVGAAWLRRTCGSCGWCRRGAENLCRAAEFTGWDADGGFAEYAVVPEAFAYRLPDALTDEQTAPLLCSGIIGYRALVRAQLPPAGRLGIYGFGASAHLTAQIAVAQGAEVHVLTRGESAKDLARRLGVASVGDAYAAPPVPLDSAVLFAPVGDLVPVALAALEQGGTLSVAGIHLSDVPGLDYQQHLFRERTLTSVTANTRADGEALLALAAALDVRAHVHPVSFADADSALEEIAHGDVSGAGVLVVA